MITGYPKTVIREVEQEKIKLFPVDALMGKAAEGVAAAVVELLGHPERTGGRGQKTAPSSKKPLVVGLVGGGDNGGDALYALSYLAGAGYATQAIILHPQPHSRGLEAAQAAGVKIIRVNTQKMSRKNLRHLYEQVNPAAIWVDGILGTGLNGAVRSPLAGVISALAAWKTENPNRKIVAIDLPSGLHSDDGQLPKTFLPADLTVTMGGIKAGLLLPPAREAVGEIRIVDLGLTLPDPEIFQLTAADVGKCWPIPGAADHKYTRGVVQVVAGSQTYPLTGVMCVEAAGKSGAGMVRYQGPEEASLAILSRLPETVTAPGQYQSLLIGPGLDTADKTAVQAVLEQVQVAVAGELPIIVDAGAIEIWAQIEKILPARGAHATQSTSGGRLRQKIILTPHAGEAARLASELGGGATQGGVARAEIEAAPHYWAKWLAAKTGATVVLKGAVTLIVSPEPAVADFVQNEAPAWAGTAGSGDVLAGIIAGVLASWQARAQVQGQKLTARAVTQAAASAVWVHGTAARLAADMPAPAARQPRLINLADSNREEKQPSIPGLGHPITATEIAGKVAVAIGYALSESQKETR